MTETPALCPPLMVDITPNFDNRDQRYGEGDCLDNEWTQEGHQRDVECRYRGRMPEVGVTNHRHRLVDRDVKRRSEKKCSKQRIFP